MNTTDTTAPAREPAATATKKPEQEEPLCTFPEICRIIGRIERTRIIRIAQREGLVTVDRLVDDINGTVCIIAVG